MLFFSAAFNIYYVNSIKDQITSGEKPAIPMCYATIPAPPWSTLGSDFLDILRVNAVNNRTERDQISQVDILFVFLHR